MSTTGINIDDRRPVPAGDYPAALRVVAIATSDEVDGIFDQHAKAGAMQ